MAGGDVTLDALVKRFGETNVIRGIDLEVQSGEFFSLLGPSGCGKTTTLRLIAGLEEPTSGEILLDGKSLAGTPAHRRHVNTVFQGYMLFPHLTVFDNVAFGLRRQKVAKSELRRRVEDALALVQMDSFAKRRPAHLSGGQQQRVALARAFVLEPAVLLLDEPLGALDAKLRKQLQVDLKALQQQLGITFIYVTHDQEEALTMSDRIAVMNEGLVEQCARPAAVYEEPETTFVADFLGTSNLISATASAHAGGCELRIGEFSLTANGGNVAASGETKVLIRPERIALAPRDAPGPNRLPGMIERVVYMGNASQIVVRLPTGDALQALQQSTGEPLAYQQGDPVYIHLPPDALRVLADTGQAPLEEGAPALA